MSQELEQEKNTNNQIRDMQSKVEVDLKKQVGDLQTKLNSSLVGRQSESEMYQEAMLKTQKLEKTLGELNAKVKKFSIFSYIASFSHFTREPINCFCDNMWYFKGKSCLNYL